MIEWGTQPFLWLECRGDPHAEQISSQRTGDADIVVQRGAGFAGADGAAAASGDGAADWAAGPGGDLSDGTDRAGSFGSADDCDSRAGAGGDAAVEADSAVSRAPSGKGAGYAGEDLLQA